MKRTLNLTAVILLAGSGLAGFAGSSFASPGLVYEAARSAETGIYADFNGDTFSDLVVGIPLEDVDGKTNAGAVSVIYGTATGLSGTNSQLFVQGKNGINDIAEAGDRFGSSVVAGDFNGDSFADIAVGVPSEDFEKVTDAGAVAVIYGSPTGLSGTGDRHFTQGHDSIRDTTEMYDRFGEVLAVADFGNTPHDDLAVGVPSEDFEKVTDAGAVAVIYGSPTGLSGTGDRHFTQGHDSIRDTTEMYDRFGQVLAVADFGNTPHDDLAVGVPSEDFEKVTNAGAVAVIYGSPTGLSGTGDRHFTQGHDKINDIVETGDQFGQVLAVADFGNTPHDDLAVGVPSEDFEKVTDAGAVAVIYGSPTGLTGTGDRHFTQGHDSIRDTTEMYDRFGQVLAVADFGNTPHDDLAVGVPSEDFEKVTNAGAVAVIYGSPTGLSGTGDRHFTQGHDKINDIVETGDQFGQVLAVADFGNTSHDDLAVGVPSEDFEKVTDAGAVAVIYGSPTGLTGTGDRHFTQGHDSIRDTTEMYDRFGQVLAVADFGNTPHDDLAVGVPSEDFEKVTNAGAVAVIYGSPTGLSGTGDRHFTQGHDGIGDAAEKDDHFGQVLAVA